MEGEMHSKYVALAKAHQDLEAAIKQFEACCEAIMGHDYRRPSLLNEDPFYQSGRSPMGSRGQ
jgi:hypothetical protein